MTMFLSWEEAFVVVALRNTFPESGEGRSKRVCILIAIYSIAFLRFAFFIWRYVRCFHGTFSQINFYQFSGEALNLPLAFVYNAVLSLSLPRAYKIFCSRIWNLMLVSAAATGCQPPLNFPGIIWLTQLQSNFLMIDSSLIEFDLEFF